METHFVKIYSYPADIPQHKTLEERISVGGTEEEAVMGAVKSFKKAWPNSVIDCVEIGGVRRFPGYGKQFSIR